MQKLKSVPKKIGHSSGGRSQSCLVSIQNQAAQLNANPAAVAAIAIVNHRLFVLTRLYHRLVPSVSSNSYGSHAVDHTTSLRKWELKPKSTRCSTSSLASHWHPRLTHHAHVYHHWHSSDAKSCWCWFCSYLLSTLCLSTTAKSLHLSIHIQHSTCLMRSIRHRLPSTS